MDAAQSAAVTVGFDIGGTNLRAAVVDVDGTVIERRSTKSWLTPEGLEDSIADLTDSLRQHHEIAAVGIAVAGFLDAACETVRFAPHLPWRHAPVRRALEDRLGLPVRLEHDANSAAWGEYRFGAAAGSRTWVLFAIGTGIGATIMLDGRIFRGAFGTAPEFGHLTVVPGGRPCPCGKLGCLERYCSGTALVSSAIEIVHSRHFHDSRLAELVRCDPAAVDGRVVSRAAAAGDPAGLAVFEEFATWLGQGLSIVADVIDPELIVIGGGLSRISDLYLDSAREVLASRIVGTGYRPLPRLATAELGPDAGMIGVADLAWQLVG